MLGRSSAGATGDADAGGVGEAALERLDAALRFREAVVRSIEEAEVAGQPRPLQADSMLAMADRHVHETEAAAKLAREADADDGGLREAIPGLDDVLNEMTVEQWARDKSPHDVLREELPGLEDALAEELAERNPCPGLADDGAFRRFLLEAGDNIDDDTIAGMVREGLEDA